MKIILIVLVSIISIESYSQDEIVYTKDFTDILEGYKLRIHPPSAQWLHPLPYLEDDYGKYDMVFVSEDDSVEMKFIFKHKREAQTILSFPHLECSRLITQFATNNQKAYINIRELSAYDLKNKYNADWGMHVNFVPKQEITTKKKGKMILLFKEDHSLITSIIFYNNRFLPQDYLLPISYITNN